MEAGNLYEIVKRKGNTDENPYPDNLCELTVRVDYYRLQKLRKAVPLINLNKVVGSAIESLLAVIELAGGDDE